MPTYVGETDTILTRLTGKGRYPVPVMHVGADIKPAHKKEKTGWIPACAGMTHFLQKS